MYMILLKERIGKLLEDLAVLVYPDRERVSAYRMHKEENQKEAPGTFSHQVVRKDTAASDTTDWQLFDGADIWGGHREYYWFETVVTIPEAFDGKCVVYRLNTGQEGQWDATNPQFALYVNGKLKQGMDVNHTEAVLAEPAKAGDTYRIVLSAFTGDQNFRLSLDSCILTLDRRTEQYYYDLRVPYEVALLLQPEDGAYIELLKAINSSLNLLDLRKTGSPAYYESLERAQAYIKDEFYGKQCGEHKEKVYCVGHTHIDVAWLWSLSVTRDKAVRSFSTVLEMMKQYPEYRFMSSQPQLYRYVKEQAPEVYAGIRQRAAEGRWETEGGMWLEADCNLASGESLVRQFIYGKRFFQEEFGVDNKILWLPDVFGYSAALPQIMEKCGIRYFMTTKISWNEFNKMPYDTFMWQGIDGTRILTHFSPSRDYVMPGSELKNYTTYNADLAPLQVKGGWQRYQQKALNSSVLMSFGFGDGGGGPTRLMLEEQRRLARGIPGCPQTVITSAGEFFQTLEDEVEGRRDLPVWAGELYLEYHRGTYTSMARNKRYNRKSEFTYQNAEFFGVLSQMLAETVYPKERLKAGWEMILLNQFHDILPGSSIKEVYDESKEQYEAVLAAGQEMIDDSLHNIASRVDAPADALVVFQPNGACKDALVSFVCPQNIQNPAVYADGNALPVQQLANGTVLFTADLPAKGYRTFELREEQGGSETGMKVTPIHMENDFFSIDLTENGQFSSIYDKRAGRELLMTGHSGNVLMSYEDRPHNFDAWELNNYYIEKSWEIDELASVTVTECGPVRGALKLVRHYLDSVIVQEICIYRDIARIDIHNEIDWKEDHIFVKALFPVDIRSDEATFDIQFGNVRRPAHYNTMWDFARFEVCAHKWLDFSEDGYGVSFLNDCKYGCSVHDGVIGLSLLKSATYPNPAADKEQHTFTYSIYPHVGGWREAGTVAQAYQLNNPAAAVIKGNAGGTLPASWSLISCDQENVVIEVVKKAEDDGSMIVRLYECYNRRTRVALKIAGEVLAVVECDMLEWAETGQVLTRSADLWEFEVKPYEIKTLKVRREK